MLLIYGGNIFPIVTLLHDDIFRENAVLRMLICCVLGDYGHLNKTCMLSVVTFFKMRSVSNVGVHSALVRVNEQLLERKVAAPV
jgi:hypothetical protein